MKNIVKIKHSDLTQNHLDENPVWAWVEDSWEEDLICPVVASDPLPEDPLALFIKADFWTPEGFHLKGFVVGDNEVFDIELFVDDKVFGFNIRLQDLAQESLIELRKTLGNEKAQIFPLRYETKFRFADGELIAGVFDPFQ